MNVYRFRLEWMGWAAGLAVSRRLVVFAFGRAENVKWDGPTI